MCANDDNHLDVVIVEKILTLHMERGSGVHRVLPVLSTTLIVASVVLIYICHLQAPGAHHVTVSVKMPATISLYSKTPTIPTPVIQISL